MTMHRKVTYWTGLALLALAPSAFSAGLQPATGPSAAFGPPTPDDGATQSVPNIAIAPPPAPTTRPAHSFPFSEGVGFGDAIIIPITTLGKERLFIVDTGIGRTCFDNTLLPQLTAVGSQIKVAAPGTGVVSKELYLMPPLEINTRRLTNTNFRAIGADMESLRVFLGRPVEGILGYDVLCHYVVVIDCRRHLLTLFEPEDFTLPPASSTSFSIEVAKEVPGTRLALVGLPSGFVGLDTGDITGFASFQGSLLETFAPFLIEHRTVGMGDLGSPNGVDGRALHIRRPWTFDATAYDQLWIHDGDKALGHVGLEFFRDFITTFDFPRKRVYFESIRGHHQSFTDLGINYTIDHGMFVVDHLNPPAGSLDIQLGDELLASNGKPVAGRPYWQILRELRTSPKSTLTFRRKGTTINVTLPPEGSVSATRHSD
jgi:hypothetical protein